MVPTQSTRSIAPWNFGGKSSFGAVKAKDITTQICADRYPILAAQFVVELGIEVVKIVARSLDVGSAVDQRFQEEIDVSSSSRNDER
jgi:hypothetical protein